MVDNMKQKSTPTLLAALVASTLSSPVMADIILSQYVEGSGNNKAIEIANTGDQAVNLAGYELAKKTNGNGEWGSKLALSDQTLEAKSVLVVAHKNASNKIIQLTDIGNSSVTSFNGNDPVALLKDGQLHDMFGVDGGGDFAKDATFTRSSEAMTPSTVYSSSDWIKTTKDSIDGLGSFGGAAPVEPFTCDDVEFTSIHDIQGQGESSPFINGYPYITEQDFYVQGVISAVTGGLTKGFYLQALMSDGDPQTSEGLFVDTNQSQSEFKPGDIVCVKGKVQEFYQRTQLKAENNQWVKLDEQETPSAHNIEILPSDANFAVTLERYEGMLVNLAPSLDIRVTRTFGFDYKAKRNNMVLAQGQINLHPNQKSVPGSAEANAQNKANQKRRLFVESDHKAADGKVPYYPEFGQPSLNQDGSTDDYIRINDTLSDLEGVISYSYGEYRLIATNTLTKDNFVRNDQRTQQVDIERGNLRVATFNVLNYFNSPYGGDENLDGSNRGAKSFDEFKRQQTKIVEALYKLDADIVGLMEIENNGFGDNGAIAQLVDQLNNRVGFEQYAYVALDTNQDGRTNEEDFVGTDVITNGLIYRPRIAELLSSTVITLPSQLAPPVHDKNDNVIEDGKNYQRNAIASTFKVNDEELTIAVNHLKSKGSTCWEDAAPIDKGGQGEEDKDKQGSCENFRVAAAVALGEALESIEGHKIIVGDLNAYGMEDPVRVLTDLDGGSVKAARDTYIDGKLQFGDEGAVITKSYGYLNAVALNHQDSWSYSYNDEVGALDHILISPSLYKKEGFRKQRRFVDATDWHINGGESKLFDYTDRFKGDLPKYNDHFRASDHDPAVLELNMGGAFSLSAMLGLFGLALWRRRQ
jgi:predicted extracellular nuclease